jgi:hypothetical protein
VTGSGNSPTLKFSIPALSKNAALILKTSLTFYLTFIPKAALFKKSLLHAQLAA